jgi:hypothetical protein
MLISYKKILDADPNVNILLFVSYKAASRGIYAVVVVIVRSYFGTSREMNSMMTSTRYLWD